IPFSLLWGGFAFFWEGSVIGIGRRAASHGSFPAFFLLFGGVFCLIGLYMIVGRFFMDAWLRAHMRYAVTSKRVLIVRDPPFGDVRTIGLSTAPSLRLQLGVNGRGTISLGEDAGWRGRNGWSSWTPALDGT